MDQLGNIAKNLTGSPQQLTRSSIESSEAKALAIYHAKLILGCYRTGDANDPEIYVTAIAAVLSRYPRDVGARLADPKDGIAGKLKWLPTVAEIKAACDALVEADMAQINRRANLAQQFKDRDEFEKRLKDNPYKPAGPVLTDYEEAFKQYGRPIGPFEKVDDKWNRDQRRPRGPQQQSWQRYTAEELQALYRDPE